MSGNITITTNLVDLINTVGQYWTRKKGLFWVLFLEIIGCVLFLDKFGVDDFFEGLQYLIILIVVTVTVWLITSKRILFRNIWLVVFWLSISCLCALAFYYYVFPYYIKNTVFGVPLTHNLGSLILFVLTLLLGLFLDCRVFRGGRLMIVFAVNNESVAVEKTIRASIDPVVQKIIDADSNIRLIVLPFGVIKSVRKSVQYIKFPLTRADAIIFASVVDDSESNSVGYVFTGFSSRINERRFIAEEQGSMHKAILDVQLRCKEWNYVNSANDNCSRKIAISKNLEDMLKMYIGCMYLMKHNYSSALPYTNNSINNENKTSPSYRIASSLYVYSVISSARELEVDKKEYDAALAQLNHLIRTMPVTSTDPGYNKAMARVLFYKGDIKASEAYTRKFKNTPGHRWGYELNMGFYAINKKKVLEFVQHYKNLRKYYPMEKKEVDFALNFLNRQEKETKDVEYRTLLDIAIAYLYLYKNPAKARRLIKRVNYRSGFNKANKSVAELRKIIESTTKRFEIVP